MISKLSIAVPLPTGSNRGVPNVLFLGQQAYHILTLSDMFCVTQKIYIKHKIHRSVLWSHRHIRLKYLSNHISLDSGPFLSLFLSRKKKTGRLICRHLVRNTQTSNKSDPNPVFPKQKSLITFWLSFGFPFRLEIYLISIYYLQDLYIPSGEFKDFWTINSIIG